MRDDAALDALLLAWTEFVSRPVRAAIDLLNSHDVAAFEKLPLLAQRAGLTIRSRDGLPVDVSGCSFVADGRRYVVLNKSQSPERATFTLAHEMAHHILHHSQMSTTWTPIEEMEADLFAFAVLTSTTSLSDRQRYMRENVDAIASLFKSIGFTWGARFEGPLPTFGGVRAGTELLEPT